MSWNGIRLFVLSCLSAFQLARVQECTTLNRLPSLYEQYCCVEGNQGKGFILSNDEKNNHQYVLCPSTTPVSCSTLNLSPSCSSILKYTPTATSGYYNITLPNGTLLIKSCDMEGVNCDGEGGWMRVAYLNMSDPNEQCPPGFVLSLYENSNGYGSLRACKRSGSIPSCNSVSFETNGISYSKVCGRVKAFQYGSTDAISPGNQGSGLDSYYVDGVSITRGSPRKHVWTLMAGLFENQNSPKDTCPCNAGSTINIGPTFVGDDYYCESGNPKSSYDHSSYYTNDTLWDGLECTSLETNCCTNPHLPWFYKPLGTNTADYIEVRLCGNEPPSQEDSPITYYEIYVK